jgi:argininosuccinate lyase
MLATDLADFLVRQGLPFREAHSVAGRAVRRAMELDVPLDELPEGEWKALASALATAVEEAFDVQASLALRSAVGGTAPAAVAVQLAEARNRLSARHFD